MRTKVPAGDVYSARFLFTCIYSLFVVNIAKIVKMVSSDNPSLLIPESLVVEFEANQLLEGRDITFLFNEILVWPDVPAETIVADQIFHDR
jgi:hypothetical protein